MKPPSSAAAALAQAVRVERQAHARAIAMREMVDDQVEVLYAQMGRWRGVARVYLRALLERPPTPEELKCEAQRLRTAYHRRRKRTVTACNPKNAR